MNEQVAHGKVSQVHQTHLCGTLLLVFDLPSLILNLLPQLINEFLASQQDRLLVAAQRSLLSWSSKCKSRYGTFKTSSVTSKGVQITFHQS